jgi:GTP-binding protein HflX
MEEKQKAIIVGVNINDENFENSMIELKELTIACDIDVIYMITQNLNEVSTSLYVGTGKAEEIKSKVKELDANLVIFNDELSSSQLRNLGKILDVDLLDRTSLILEIFARRAKSKEAKLQVKVAKLKYMLPRLVGLHNSLGRQGGGSSLSNKGSGEKKIELDRRKIEDEITRLNKELKEIEKERDIQRRKRKNSGIPLVSLAGYTNAGKSTLMNAFIDKYTNDDDKKVEEKNMLFATLDTSVRKITLSDNKTFLLSDTVGFISKLPHNLVKAFRSTLEEIVKADLIIQVIDYSDKNYKRQIEVTNSTLKDIGAADIPIIYVYNKSDLVLDSIPMIQDDNIYISALKRQGIDELVKMIKSKVMSDYILTKFLIPYNEGSILSYLKSNSTILSLDYNEKGTIIEVECKECDYNKYIEYVFE